MRRFRFDQYAPNESPGQSTIGTTPFGQNIHRRRFPEKQQHLRCRDLGYAKNSGISARMPRANTTEPSGHNGAPMKHPALPCLPLKKLKLPCGELKRRARVASIFPYASSCLHLVSALLAEYDEDCMIIKIYLNL